MPDAQPPLKILLIDDHALFREGVALLLQRLNDRLRIAEAAGCAQALQWLADHGAADLALIDLHMPGIDGLAGLDRLRQQWPQMPAVVMSADDAPATVRAALDHGAMGFIPKSSTADAMLAALRVVLAQGVYLPPAAAGLDAPLGPPQASGSGTTPASPGLVGLGQWQLDLHQRAAPGHRAHRQPVAQRIGRSLDDRQAQAGARRLGGVGGAAR